MAEDLTYTMQRTFTVKLHKDAVERLKEVSSHIPFEVACPELVAYIVEQAAAGDELNSFYLYLTPTYEHYWSTEIDSSSSKLFVVHDGGYEVEEHPHSLQQRARGVAFCGHALWGKGPHCAWMSCMNYIQKHFSFGEG